MVVGRSEKRLQSLSDLDPYGGLSYFEHRAFILRHRPVLYLHPTAVFLQVCLRTRDQTRSRSRDFFGSNIKKNFEWLKKKTLVTRKHCDKVAEE